MITLEFFPFCEIHNMETVELPDREAFFDFYITHYDKGVIFNVQEVPND